MSFNVVRDVYGSHQWGTTHNISSPQSCYTSIFSYRYNPFLLAIEILTEMLHTNIELERKNCRMVPTLTLWTLFTIICDFMVKYHEHVGANTCTCIYYTSLLAQSASSTGVWNHIDLHWVVRKVKRSLDGRPRSIEIDHRGTSMKKRHDYWWVFRSGHQDWSSIQNSLEDRTWMSIQCIDARST
jgi:hypothetical protein